MSWKLLLIHVVVGIVRNANDEILIAQRPPDKYAPGLWEFPGGKVEAEENSIQALQRELKEEIGIHVIDAQSWFIIEHDYTDRIVSLDVWIVKKISGEPHGAEGQSIRWVSIPQLKDFKFPAGNQSIIHKLENGEWPLNNN